MVDVWDAVFNADIKEEPQTEEVDLPAGDHILSINWRQLSIKEWAKEGDNPDGNVLTIGFGKKGHNMCFENFALSSRWAWKLKQLYDAAGVKWGANVEELMQQQVAATVTVNDRGYRNVRNYKSLDAVAKNPPKSKPQKQTKTAKVDAENGADLDSIPF